MRDTRKLTAQRSPNNHSVKFYQKNHIGDFTKTLVIAVILRSVAVAVPLFDSYEPPRTNQSEKHLVSFI